MARPQLRIVKDVKEITHDAERQVNQVEVPMTKHLGLANLAKSVFQQVSEDHLGAYAGNLAYHGLFAIFPFLIFLLTLLGIFHATSLVRLVINGASGALPRDAVHFLGGKILNIAQSHAGAALSVGAAVAILSALCGISGGFRAVMEALNVVYEVEDARPFWKKYLISVLLALSSTFLFIVALVLVVFGSTIGRAVANTVGLGNAFEWTWNILQWPALAVMLFFALALVYYFAPDVEQRFRFVSPGSIVAVVLWVLFSLGFSLYVNNFGSYNKVYGTLAGLAIFLLFMYYSAYILLLGGEINQVIEEHAPGGKHEGEKRPHAGRQRSGC